jgi:hypothetical protein
LASAGPSQQSRLRHLVLKAVYNLSDGQERNLIVQVSKAGGLSSKVACMLSEADYETHMVTLQYAYIAPNTILLSSLTSGLSRSEFTSFPRRIHQQISRFPQRLFSASCLLPCLSAISCTTPARESPRPHGFFAAQAFQVQQHRHPEAGKFDQPLSTNPFFCVLMGTRVL